MYQLMAPIHHAAIRGDLLELQGIIEEDPTTITTLHDNSGLRMSALHYATYHGHLHIINYLIDAGGDVNQVGDKKKRSEVEGVVVVVRSSSWRSRRTCFCVWRFIS